MKKIERNAPCPCGSGKKYENCCMSNAAAPSSRWGAAQRPPSAGIQEISRAATIRKVAPADPLMHYTNLGSTLLGQGNFDGAIENYRRALALKPDFADVHCGLGYALQSQGKLNEAIECYRRALAFKPDFAGAYSNLGLALQAQGNLDASIENFRKAITLQPNFADSHYNLGIALKQQGRLDEAVASYRHALALQSNFVEAHYNLGNALQDLGKLDEAVASYRKALALKPDYADAYGNLGGALKTQGKLDEAIASYRRALSLKPDFAATHYNLGVALKQQGKLDEATASYRHALALRPDYAEACVNLGELLQAQDQLDDAIACYRRAITLKPDIAEAYLNLGNALARIGNHDEASAHYQQVLSLKPDYAFAFGQYLHSKMHCCDWEKIEDDFHELSDGIDAGKALSPPFPLLATPSSPAQQKHCAEIWVREKYPMVPRSSNVDDRYSHGKIRLGYFSSDLYNHATTYLMAELLEQHDRSRFEVIGFSFGASPNDAMRLRVSSAFDRFLEVENQSDQDIATLARNLEIDIAIDLKGFTTGARTGIFALRPAPIQVNYLGYPGTMGAAYIDYLIADPVLIPLEHQRHYTEKIVYLPDSYQVNDSHRRISQRQFTRSEVGLPAEGFVFCCFNNSFKITPDIFDIWMQLLNQVKGSVLWLLAGNTQAEQNLQKEAMQRGIAPERLVFAPRMDLPEHLARHRLADLFLDTFYCNAHTTTSDALWAGLPVLTYLGDTFAGRVAASLLNAIGLSELITHSHEEYQTLAIELAANPAQLASLKQKLAQNRLTHPLFNTKLFTRHIEDAYTQMWERHQAALLPDHIRVLQAANKSPL